MGMKEYNKAILEDYDGKHNVEAEVNFSTDKKLKKYVKITIGKQSAIVAIKDIHELALAICDIEQKADLLPYKTLYSKKLIRSHVVELTQDVRKGETVSIRCETDVPLTIYQKLEKEALEKLRNNN